MTLSLAPMSGEYLVTPYKRQNSVGDEIISKDSYGKGKCHNNYLLQVGISLKTPSFTNWLLFPLGQI